MDRTGKRMNVVKAFCLLALLGCCFISCKDDEKRKSKLLITVCLLKLWASSPGSHSRTQLLIYGKNFGNDPSLINLKLGGVETRVVNCNNECIYCMVPRNAGKGTINFYW